MKKTLLFLLTFFTIMLVSCDLIDTSLIDTSMFEKEAELYTVTFDTDGGSVVNSLEVKENCMVKRPKNPTKDGYVFDAWYSEDGSKWVFLQDIVEYDMTLYAKWLPLQNVNFVTDYGQIPETQSVGYGKYATEPTITYEGYYVESWYDEYENQWNFEEFPIKRDTTLTAKWEKMAQVSINGEISYVIPGSEIGELPQLIKSGAYFLGWYRRNDLFALEMVEETTVIYEDTTLIPKWEENENVILITLDANVGWIAGDVNQINSEKGAKLERLPQPYSQGSSYFLGWYDENGVRYSKNSVAYTDLTLTARYQFHTECSVNEDKNHRFSPWDYEPMVPSCTEDAIAKRFCLDCEEYEYDFVGDAYGHKYNDTWTYSFMKKSRKCYVCDYTQVVEFSDVTQEAVNFATVTGEAYNIDKADCLFNGEWNDSTDETFCGKNDTSLTVTVRLNDPISIDGIYLKGIGTSSIDVKVKFQGDTDFTLVCISNFGTEPTFASIPNKPITAIELTMAHSGNGVCFWQEVALVKVPQV